MMLLNNKEEAILTETIGKIFQYCFTSPNVADSNLEPANLVDTTHHIASALSRIADALEKIDEELAHRGR